MEEKKDAEESDEKEEVVPEETGEISEVLLCQIPIRLFNFLREYTEKWFGQHLVQEETETITTEQLGSLIEAWNIARSLRAENPELFMNLEFEFRAMENPFESIREEISNMNPLVSQAIDSGAVSPIDPFRLSYFHYHDRMYHAAMDALLFSPRPF
jgi:hypothetical protein